jgi:chromosome segregation ATPase
MADRIAELESHLRAWERRSRRTILFVLIPIAVAAALAYAGQARLARFEQALSEGLAGLSAEPVMSSATSLEQNLELLPGLVAELKSLRPLPGQLMAERDARTRAETDLARIRDESSSLVGDRDGLATALGTAKGELARAQAERADFEQRLQELQREMEARQAALAQRDRALATANAEREGSSQALETERAARIQAERQLAAEREGRAATERARSEIAARLGQVTAQQTATAQQAARTAEELRNVGTERARLVQELNLAQTRATSAERAQADLQQQVRELRAALAQAQAQRSSAQQPGRPTPPSEANAVTSPRL